MSPRLLRGGRTPVAGIAHAFVLLAIVLVFAPFARHIPLATLSAIVPLIGLILAPGRDKRHQSRLMRPKLRGHAP